MSGKYALIIGNTDYTDPGLAKLSAPGKDAEDFARVLSDKEICAFDEVNTRLNESSSSVIEIIDEFFDQKKPDDLLVLYFSGHGVRDEFGSLYLAFKNTIRSRLRSTAIKSDYIRDVMDQSRSKRQVLILDCCNSGAFPQGAKAEVGGVMGMVSALQGYGRFVLTASDATQFAWEGNQIIGETDNSLFTHFLVKGLEGEADSDGDGRITVDELYDYAYGQILRVTPKQTPTKSISKQEGEIVLRQLTRVEDIKPVPLPTPLLETIENPFADIRLGAVQELTKLLNGKNLGLARSAKEALQRITEVDDSNRVKFSAKQALESSSFTESITNQPAKKEERSDITKENLKRTQADVKSGPKAEMPPATGQKSKAEVEREEFARKRSEAIKAAREREQIERQLKLKPTAATVSERVVQEQKPNQQRNAKTLLTFGGASALLICCILGSSYLWSRFRFPVPIPSSNTPTATITPIIVETGTLTLTASLPTDTPIIIPTATFTTEASPTSTKTNTLPQLFLQGNIITEGDTISGAIVTYQASATDAEDGLLSVDCAPSSGSLFSVGSTSVNCVASDSQGATTTRSFTVEVKDTNPPTIASHGSVSVQATSDSGALVTYTNPTTSDIVDGTGTAYCSLESGKQFKIGDTTVTCTATDSHGNPAVATTFNVHVTSPPNNSILVLVYWDRDNNGLHGSSDFLLSADVVLYAGSSCSGAVFATPLKVFGYKFVNLADGTYCVKVNSVEHVDNCVLVPRNGINRKTYKNLQGSEDREDLSPGFPYVCS